MIFHCSKKLHERGVRPGRHPVPQVLLYVPQLVLHDMWLFEAGDHVMFGYTRIQIWGCHLLTDPHAIIRVAASTLTDNGRSAWSGFGGFDISH